MVTIKLRLTTQSPCIYGQKRCWNAKMYITSHHDTDILLERILFAVTVSGWKSPSRFTNTVLFPLAAKNVWEEILELEITRWKVETAHNFTKWNLKESIKEVTCPSKVIIKKKCRGSCEIAQIECTWCHSRFMFAVCYEVMYKRELCENRTVSAFCLFYLLKWFANTVTGHHLEYIILFFLASVHSILASVHLGCVVKLCTLSCHLSFPYCRSKMAKYHTYLAKRCKTKTKFLHLLAVQWLCFVNKIPWRLDHANDHLLWSYGRCWCTQLSKHMNFNKRSIILAHEIHRLKSEFSPPFLPPPPTHTQTESCWQIILT